MTRKDNIPIETDHRGRCNLKKVGARAHQYYRGTRHPDGTIVLVPVKFVDDYLEGSGDEQPNDPRS